jgi:drug/metabolite transporter (DMT)-like permease
LKPSHPRLLIAAAAILWSTAGAAIKLSSLGAAELAGGRALIAAVALWLLIPASRGRWTPAVMKTAVAYALTCGLFIWANTLTTAGSVIFIQDVAPVWVLLLGTRWLGERPTRAELLSVPIALAGCALFFAEDLGQGSRAAGNLLALASSVSYALLIVRYRQTSEAEGLAAQVAGNALVVLAALPFAGLGHAAAASTTDLGVLLYLGVVQLGLASAIFLRGVQGVSALEASLLALLEPVMSPIWAFFFAGERLGRLALLGAALVIGATALRLRLPHASAEP